MTPPFDDSSSGYKHRLSSYGHREAKGSMNQEQIDQMME